MSAKAQFLKKLQASQTGLSQPTSRGQADMAEFRQRMIQLQETIEGWLEQTGIRVESTEVPLVELLLGAGAFRISGIRIHYQERLVTFTPSFLYGQGVTGCVDITLYAQGDRRSLGRLFMRSCDAPDWTYMPSVSPGSRRVTFCEPVFFELLDSLLPQ